MITPPTPPSGHYTNTGIGATLGTLAGGPVGTVVGTLAESLISSAFGGGDKGPGLKTQLNLQHNALRRQTERYPSWLVKGAKDAGLHPLAALGISPTSGPSFSLNTDVGSSMGQNIGRAVRAAFTSKQSEADLEKLTLERAQLENDLLRAQISNINFQPGTPPVKVISDENLPAFQPDPGLTAGSLAPPPAAKKFTVGDTPYGPVYMNLPPSGQADEMGELYGAAKGLEYMAKRGYVHYSNGTYRAGKALRAKIKKMLGR